MPGTIELSESGYEINCDYKNLKSDENKRQEYLTALSRSLKNAKKPILIHVNAYEDLPTEQEISMFKLNNLISKDNLRNIQYDDKEDKRISEFKNKNTDTLFTTKCSRGVDFPGDLCNSIIFTKYPNPNIRELYWRILKKTKPYYFWSIYKDKARREFLQRIYRALRFPEDKVQILSPDSRIITAVKDLIS